MSKERNEHRTLLCGQCGRKTVVDHGLPLAVEVLRSSTFPSEAETVLQQQLADSDGLILQEYDREIDALKSTLQKLEADRLSIKKRIIARRYYISSQRKLPAEVWRKIFRGACSLDEYYHVGNAPYLANIPLLPPIELDSEPASCRATPLTLSLVCLRWRDIIFDFPELWACMRLGMFSLTKTRLAKLETFLERARTYPLTLWLDSSFGEVEIEGFNSVAHGLLLKLLSQSKHLVVPLSLIQGANFQGSLSFPFLRSLSLISYYNVSSDASTESFGNHQFETILSAPLLDRLVVSELTSLPFSDELNRPSRASSLRSMGCLQPITKAELTAIAYAFPQLRELNFQISEEDSNWHTRSGQTIAFPALETLDIQIDMGGSAGAMDWITVPSLRDLKITFSMYSDEAWRFGDSLCACIRRSGCSVTSLHLATVISPESNWLLELFTLSPELKSLHLSTRMPFEGLPNSLFYRLCRLLTVSQGTGAEGADVPLPCLDTLVLQIVDMGICEPTGSGCLTLDLVHRFLLMLESRVTATSLGFRSSLHLPTHSELIISPSFVPWASEDGEVLKYIYDGMELTNLGWEDMESRRQKLESDGMRCVIDKPGSDEFAEN
ncbi:hypothetical protein PQX77_012767 [Marasmius sp. AFHP31]|nr:hypothetical protein PQX77_012767 [Marasmius sp. AFHP31]